MGPEHRYLPFCRAFERIILRALRLLETYYALHTLEISGNLTPEEYNLALVRLHRLPHDFTSLLYIQSEV